MLVRLVGQRVGVGHERLAQAQEAGGDGVGRLRVIPGQPVARAGVQPQYRLEGAELHPARVQVGVVLRVPWRRAEEAADVVAHVRLVDAGLVGGKLGLEGERVPGAPGVAGEGERGGVPDHGPAGYTSSGFW